MPSRSRYTIWDYLWVSRKDVQRERVRSPHPLGRRRSLPQRLVLMWRGSVRDRMIWGIGAGCVWVGVLGLIFWLQVIAMQASLVLLIWLVLACCTIFVFELLIRPDARCVYASHVRTRSSKQQNRLDTAREVAQRREWWRIRTREMSMATKFSVISFSSTGRWITAVFFVTAASGSLLNMILSQMIVGQGVPSHRGGAAGPTVRINNGLGFSPVFLLFAGMMGYFAYRYMHLKNARVKLDKCLEGKACADCGYEVEPGALIETEPGVLIAIGPPRCSECGSPWPLVPPQAVKSPQNQFWQM